MQNVRNLQPEIEAEGFRWLVLEHMLRGKTNPEVFSRFKVQVKTEMDSIWIKWSGVNYRSEDN